jgi:hypothetical protein
LTSEAVPKPVVLEQPHQAKDPQAATDGGVTTALAGVLPLAKLQGKNPQGCGFLPP